MKYGSFIIGAIIAIIILGTGWYLISPLFIDTVVEEEFPLVPEPIGIPSPEELSEMSPEQLEEIRDEVMEEARKMPDKVMEESTPLIPPPLEGGKVPPEPEPLPTEPVVLSQGTFTGADSFHQGSGNATIYQLPSGSRFLRLEDFSVTNGPDLRVILTTHPSPRSQTDVQEGYIELASLKGNKGNQNYDILPDTDISQYKSVVIYCKPFHVVFATATLN